VLSNPGLSDSAYLPEDHTISIMRLPLIVQPPGQGAAHPQLHDQPVELLKQFLLVSPEIGRRVSLGAVCHEWRLALTRRAALCAMLSSPLLLRPLPDPMMVPTLCAVLARCPALASLDVSVELASEPLFAALERLDCAKSLHVFRTRGYVIEPRVRLARILAASLPARVELDGDPSTFEAAADEHAGLPASRVLSLCCPPDFPRARSFWAGLSGLRQLCVGLPLSVPLTVPCRQLLADLRQAIPRLEALDLYEQTPDAYVALDGRDWIVLLDGAASALRVLSVHVFCGIQAGFAAFVERSLAGLE